MANTRPKNKIQKLCHERFQYGKKIYKEMNPFSPTQIGKKYGMHSATISSIANGGGTKNLTEEEIRDVRESLAEYRKLREEYLKHTCGAIANDYGMSRKTVYEYGVGNFGSRTSPNQIKIIDETMLQPEAIEQFLTMRTVANPARYVPTYY